MFQKLKKHQFLFEELVPIACLVIFNTGLGLILSALQVFFRDMQYLWKVLTQLLMWCAKPVFI